MKVNNKSRINKKSRNKKKHLKKRTRKNKPQRKRSRGGMSDGNEAQISLDSTTEDCPICLDPMILNNNTTFTNLFEGIEFPCRHIYHKGCFIEMIKSSRNAGNNVNVMIIEITCPMCRAPFSEEGIEVVYTINRILDIDNEETRMRMFRDILQYNTNENFFQIYIIPLARRTASFAVSDTANILGTGTLMCLEILLTGSNARQQLLNSYSVFLFIQIFRLIFNVTNLIRRENQMDSVNSIVVFYVCFSSMALFHNIQNREGGLDTMEIIRGINEIFSQFLVDDNDFYNYFNAINDGNNREPPNNYGGSAEVSHTSLNKNNISRFKFTSMEDVDEFSTVFKKNKRKLESLLDNVPFRLSVIFPEIEYSRDLVEKLEPIVKQQNK
jgi:hypothetical protein